MTIPLRLPMPVTILRLLLMNGSVEASIAGGNL